MKEVIINYGVDPSDKIKVIDGIEYIPKAIFDDVVADRRRIAIELVRITKDLEDWKQLIRNKKNEVEKFEYDEKAVRLVPEKELPLEKKIRPNWAFLKRGQEMAKINAQIYEELLNKYKVSADISNTEADVVIEVEYQAYVKRYRVLRNRPNLTADQVALIVDNGSLCFGFSGTNDNGKVWLS